MKFSLYNILSHLIPGFLVSVAGLHFFDIEPTYFDPVISTAIAYVVGYFVNTIGAWIEFVLNWTWGGRPSNQLLQGKNCGRIHFSQYKELRGLLLKKLNKEITDIDTLFKLAMRLADDSGRIEDMNGQYAFARSIFIAIFFTSILFGLEHYQNFIFWIFCLSTIVISWYRAKERGFYYAREVLFKAMNNLEEVKSH